MENRKKKKEKKDREKKKQKPRKKESPQTKQIILKEFSQMKKFTFIRFIEPAEREEIGIGHYGEGQAGVGDWGTVRRGPGSPSPETVASRYVCNCLVKCSRDSAEVRLAP